MPPGSSSRYLFTSGVVETGGTFLSERVPFRYRDLSDNRVHIAKAGDTWDSLAGEYFAGLPRASGFWWAIAEFQPAPVVDPTLQIQPGTRVIIPSTRVLTTVILGERRRREHG